MNVAITTMAMMLAGLMAVLGFVALLCTKIYTISDAGQRTEVDVPWLGKMRTNYPALVFAMIGSALAIYAMKMDADLQQTTQWKISGHLQLPADAPGRVDWRDGCIKLVPGFMDASIQPDGSYDLIVRLRNGVAFDQVAQTIYYSNGPVSASIETSNLKPVGTSVRVDPLTVKWWKQ